MPLTAEKLAALIDDAEARAAAGNGTSMDIDVRHYHAVADGRSIVGLVVVIDDRQISADAVALVGALDPAIACRLAHKLLVAANCGNKKHGPAH